MSDGLVWLSAGALTLALDGPDLRYIAYDGDELVRRIYMAVRDLDWDTIPGTVLTRSAEVSDDAFAVRMELENRGQGIGFDWTLDAKGGPDGIEYAMLARARGSFAFAKIGLNIHHPIAGLAGRRWRATATQGPTEGQVPDLIYPQIELRNEGWHLPVFPPVSEMALEHDAGTATFWFGGDLYEMEDQRNWSDASFKTYSMPAHTGYEHHAVDGQEIVQRVRMTFEPKRPTARRPGQRVAGPPTSTATRLEIGAPLKRVLPPVGLAHSGALRDADAARIAALAPAHLRLDIDLAGAWEEALSEGLDACLRLDAALELALFVAGDPRELLPAMAARVKAAGVPVARVLVFAPGEEATPAAWVVLVRESLALDAPCGGGTNMYYNELNRSLPYLEPFEVVAWSVNPQVHAFTDRDLVENLDGQSEQLRSARAFAGDRQVVVTPVSLKPRFNAVARPGAMSSDNTDPRQSTLLAAGWTLGSIKRCAESGADAITYYETVGARGVVEGDETFPLYHPVADAAALTGGMLYTCESHDEPWLMGLAVESGSATVLLVANLCDTAREVEVAVGARTAARARILDEASATLAATEPGRFRAASGVAVQITNRVAALPLGPYATARVELT